MTGGTTIGDLTTAGTTVVAGTMTGGRSTSGWGSDHSIQKGRRRSLWGTFRTIFGMTSLKTFLPSTASS